MLLVSETCRRSHSNGGIADAGDDGVTITVMLEKVQLSHPKFGKLRRDRLQHAVTRLVASSELYTVGRGKYNLLTQ